MLAAQKAVPLSRYEALTCVANSATAGIMAFGAFVDILIVREGSDVGLASVLVPALASSSCVNRSSMEVVGTHQ